MDWRKPICMDIIAQRSLDCNTAFQNLHAIFSKSVQNILIFLERLYYNINTHNAIFREDVGGGLSNNEKVPLQTLRDTLTEAFKDRLNND